MSLLSRRATPPTEQRSTYSLNQLAGLFRDSGGLSPNSVTQVDTALGHPTVYRSVNKIAGVVANMSLDARRGRQTVDPKPPLLADPSPGVMLPSVWKRTAATSMLLQGGAYALLSDSATTRMGFPTRLDLIDPSRVKWTSEHGWQLDNHAIDLWPQGNLWHVPLMVLPGSPKGVNPLEYARRTTYAGLAAMEFGGNFFKEGAHPTAIMESADKDLTPEAATALKLRLKELVTGTNREPLVVPAGTKWHQLQVNPQDSQFIDLMAFSDGQLAGFFGLMPEHVGLAIEGGTSVQYSNRENRQQDLLQDAIMPVIRPLEEALSAIQPDSFDVQFNVAGVLRADLAARYNSYKTAAEIESLTGSAVLTTDEMRDLEGREPLPPSASQQE